VQVIAIGNGTACRETEELVSELIGALEARRRGEVPAVGASEIRDQKSEFRDQKSEVGDQKSEVGDQKSEVSPPPVPDVTVPSQEPPSATAETAAANPPTAETAAAPPPAEPAVATPPPPPPPNPLEGLPEAPADLAYIIVNEAGASVYSASPVGREEFPEYDATLRGTISIGRRLQDPLSELVKIDPQHVGVGLYQHDVNPRHLKESLEGVIESCVNAVGVDLNTASVPLLRHVSGMNQLVAHDLVEFRKTNGPFRRREQLMQVPGIGDARYTQAAGFLKIQGGDSPLDQTWIHPESYPAALQLLTELGYGPEVLNDRDKTAELHEKLKTISPDEVAQRLNVGTPTLRDMIDALARPGRDPREDLPPPVFKKGVLKLEDLQPGMELKGTVLNVVDFGGFVDIGLKDSGLVHISQMANRYVKSPYDVVAVGDVVTVWVLAVDKDRRRVSLTMIKPGTERKLPEKRPPQQPREPREPRPQQTQAPSPQGERRPLPPRGGGGRRPLPPRGGQQGGGRPRPAPAQGGQQGTEGSPPPAEQGAAAQRQPAPPPRKPRRQPPKPNLSDEALAGKQKLGTFAELAAYWEAMRKPKGSGEPTPPPPPAAPETPPEGQPPPQEG